MDNPLVFWIPLGTVGGLGLLGNTMVFIVLRLESNKLPVIYWLMCLAIADFGCLIFWPMAADSWKCATRNCSCSETHLKLFHASELIQDIFFTVTGYFILGASIDRYVAIALPRSSRKWSTKKNALTAIGTIVVIALVVHLACFFLHDRQPFCQATNNTTNAYYNSSTTDGQGGDSPEGGPTIVQVMHVLGLTLTQLVPLALLVVFFVLLSVRLTRANRKLSRQRYTRKYLANVSNTTVVIVIQFMFLVCSGFSVVYSLLFGSLYLIRNFEAMNSADINKAMFIAKVILVCVRVSATFFIFLALDKKFRTNASDVLACKGLLSRSHEQSA